MFREFINYASENCSEIRRQIWGKRLLCTGKTMLHEAWLGRAQSFTTPVLLFLYVSPRGEPDVSNWSDRDRFPVNVEVHSKRRDDSKQRGKQQKTALLTIVSGKNTGPRQFQRRCNAKTTRIKRRKKKGGTNWYDFLVFVHEGEERFLYYSLAGCMLTALRSSTEQEKQVTSRFHFPWPRKSNLRSSGTGPASLHHNSCGLLSELRLDYIGNFGEINGV